MGKVGSLHCVPTLDSDLSSICTDLFLVLLWYLQTNITAHCTAETCQTWLSSALLAGCR